MDLHPWDAQSHQRKRRDCGGNGRKSESPWNKRLVLLCSLGYEHFYSRLVCDSKRQAPTTARRLLFGVNLTATSWWCFAGPAAKAPWKRSRTEPPFSVLELPRGGICASLRCAVPGMATEPTGAVRWRDACLCSCSQLHTLLGLASAASLDLVMRVESRTASHARRRSGQWSLTFFLKDMTRALCFIKVGKEDTNYMYKILSRGQTCWAKGKIHKPSHKRAQQMQSSHPANRKNSSRRQWSLTRFTVSPFQAAIHCSLLITSTSRHGSLACFSLVQWMHFVICS
jgi:hypothetical protein